MAARTMHHERRMVQKIPLPRARNVSRIFRMRDSSSCGWRVTLSDGSLFAGASSGNSFTFNTVPIRPLWIAALCSPNTQRTIFLTDRAKRGKCFPETGVLADTDCDVRGIGG